MLIHEYDYIFTNITFISTSSIRFYIYNIATILTRTSSPFIIIYLLTINFIPTSSSANFFEGLYFSPKNFIWKTSILKNKDIEKVEKYNSIFIKYYTHSYFKSNYNFFFFFLRGFISQKNLYLLNTRLPVTRWVKLSLNFKLLVPK